MKNPGGNPRKTKYCDTLQQAASMAELPVDIVRAAKAAGCPAWQGHRVDWRRLKEWVGTNADKLKPPDTGHLSLKEQKLVEEIRKLKLANDREQASLVERSKVMEALQTCDAAENAMLRQKLENEYPARGFGLDIPGLRQLGRDLVDEILEVKRENAKYWDI